MVRCKHTVEIKYDLTKTENKTYKALVVALKKYPRLFAIFPRLNLYFPEFKTLYELVQSAYEGGYHLYEFHMMKMPVLIL